MHLYISPTGSDAWSGCLPDANAERTDGPLAADSPAFALRFHAIERRLPCRLLYT